MLMMTGDQTQDMVMAVCSPHSGITLPVKSDPIISICYRCSGKGHIAKDCQKYERQIGACLGRE